MTVDTFYGNEADGIVVSNSATYSAARAGTGTLTVRSGGSFTLQTGQDNAFNCYEAFIAFDTSSIADSATVSQVDLSLYLFNDGSTTDFTCEARVKSWLAAVDTSDWVAGASLSGLTRVATLNSSGIGATGAYKAFTEDGTNFQSAVSLTGNTELLLCSNRQVAGNQPTQGEWLQFIHSLAAGTTQDPKLVVTYTIPAVTKTATFDAALATRTTKTATFDAALGLRTLKTATFDAALANLTLKTLTFDAVLFGLQTKTLQWDAMLYVVQQMTVNFDAMLAPVKTLIATWDAALGQRTTQTMTFDVALTETKTKSLSWDAALILNGLKTAVWDAVLAAGRTASMTFDAVLTDQLPRTASGTLNANYADSQTLDGLYASAKTLNANYADAQTLEVA